MASDGKSTAEAEASQALICAILDYYAGGNGRQTNNQIIGREGFIKKILPNLSTGNNLYDEFIAKLKEKDKKFSDEKIYNPGLLKLSGTQVSSCRKFLNSNKDWFISSISIANSLYVQIGQKIPSWKGALKTSDFFYHRDPDEKGLMGVISKIFGVVNSTENGYFTSRDRWCPADIYFASAKGFDILTDIKEKLLSRSKLLEKNKKLSKQKKLLKPELPKPETISLGGKKHQIELSFYHINDLFRGLVRDKHLLPLSLKKVGTSNYSIAPVKIFNSAGSRSGIMADTTVKSNYKINIQFGEKYIKFGGENNANFYSSIDMFIIAKPPISEGYTSFRMQIRDKGGSSSNSIRKDQTETGWKSDMQGIAQFKPAVAQAGGVGGGTLSRIIDPSFENSFKNEKKSLVTAICGKLSWVGNNVSFDGERLDSSKSGFLNEFRDLHIEMLNSSAVEIAGDRSAPSSTSSPKEILLFYAKKLTKSGNIVAKSGNSGNTRRYKVAQWLYSKYFCLRLAKKLLSNTKINNVDPKQLIFVSALSMDPRGPSGKLGGGSGFFVKAG